MTALRHDSVDLRRLAELGFTALDWRRPPARMRRSAGSVVIIDAETVSGTTLNDIIKSLSIAGYTPRLVDSDSATAPTGEAAVIRFGNGTTVAHADTDDGAVLPTISTLRGNAAAKRQAWLTLRSLLRR